MTKINSYSASPQSNDGSAAKGTSGNPYTQEEFDALFDAGEWKGGYVEGVGYVGGNHLPEVVIYASFGSDSDSWSDPWGSTDNPWDDSQNPDGDNGDSPTGGGNPGGGNPGGGNPGGGNPGGGSQGGGSQGGGGGNNSESGATGEENSNIDTSDVLPASAFRGFLYSDKTGCFNRCREMLAIAKCQLNGDEIAMTHYDSNGRATTATNNFVYGLNYIDGQLQQKKPVIVAVDYKEKTSMGSTRLDQAGDHFVIIVGGSQTNGYHYFDPATGDKEKGTSPNNVFTIEGDLMKDTNTCIGSYYILTSIRENK